MDCSKRGTNWIYIKLICMSVIKETYFCFLLKNIFYKLQVAKAYFSIIPPY